MLLNARILVLLTASLLTRGGSCTAQTFDANHPASSGYKLTFDDEFDSLASIDVAASGKPGYKWYTKRFFGYKATSASLVSIGNGILTLDGPTGCNYSIATAAPASNADGYTGTVFSGGGYFEASIAFDNSRTDVSHGFPAFWSVAIEHMADKGASQWIGEDPGFEHFIEVDIFEANTFAKAGPDTYSGAVHDWYGSWTQRKDFHNLMNVNYIIGVPSHTDFAKFHRYGRLIVPATPANRECGYIQYFFDGLPSSDIVTWRGGQLPGTPPPAGDARFAITDLDHLNVILGCGEGDKMRVDYVRVWQQGGEH